VIYDKFISSQAKQAAAAEHMRKAPVQREEKKQVPAWRRIPRWMIVALPVLLVVAAAVVWAVAGRSTTDNDGQVPGLESQGVSFDYPLEGTWEGSLRQTYPGTKNSFSYDAEYNATVIVEKGGTVKEVRWTDSHSPDSRREVIWREGDAEVVCLDRRGSILMGRREIVLNNMEEYLKVQRQGAVLAVSHKCRDNLELDFSIPDAFPRKEVDAELAPKMEAGQDSSVTIEIPVHVLPGTSWTVPSSRITHKVLSPENSRETWLVTKKTEQNPGTQGDTVYTSIVKDLQLTDGLVRLWVMLQKSYLPREGLNPFDYNDKGEIAPDPKNLSPIEGRDIMKVSASPFNCRVRLRFAPDAQVTLEVVGNRLRYNNQFMIYTLKRAG
jgi:hypothetical protein